MLSHEDERRLHAIERQMLDEDPDFVHRFRRSAATSMSASRALVIVCISVLAALVTLGVGVGLCGLLTASPMLIFTGGGLAAVAGYELRRLRRRR
jgi:hypothetical protein